MILLQDPVIADIAKKHKRTPAQVILFSVRVFASSTFLFWGLMMHLIVLQVLLRYHVQQGIVVIPKSMKPHHILENTKVRL